MNTKYSTEQVMPALHVKHSGILIKITNQGEIYQTYCT